MCNFLFWWKFSIEGCPWPAKIKLLKFVGAWSRSIFFYRLTMRIRDLFLPISCRVQIYSRLTNCRFLFVNTLLDILPIFYIHCRFVGFRFSICRQLMTNYYHFGLVCAWMPRYCRCHLPFLLYLFPILSEEEILSS